MKAFRIFKKSISESFKGVFRNGALSLAAISSITITLVLVGFSIILSYNVHNFTKEIEKDLTIVVFLDRDTDSDTVKEIKTKIEDIGNIRKIEFNSKEDVRKEMQGESEIFESIMSQYTPETNPLQDTYLVKVDDINTIGDTADKIAAIDKVDLVKYGEGSVEELVKIFDMVTKIMFIVVIALILITAFLIGNTIKITIQSRKREIEIRRLVGASNLFIKQPFFFEGIILGFFGSIIPVGVICFGYTFLYDKLGGQLFTAIVKLVKPNEIIYITSIVVVVLGIVVGAFGSSGAVRKHLKI